MKKLLVRAGAASLLFAAVVVWVSLYQMPTYEASAKVLVDLQAQCPRQICLIPNAPITPTTQLAAQTVRIDSLSVAKETVRRLGLPRGAADELLHNLTAELDPGTMFIRLTYTDTDPTRAKQIVGTVGQVASERITRTSTEKMPVGAELTAVVWDIKAPYEPVSPKPLRNGLIALVAGLLLASAWAIAAKLARIRPPPADLDRGPA